MKKPKILVTAASGKTGFATGVQLLEKGYPVRALVQRTSHRSEKLHALGAEIALGNLDDIVDVRRALDGVQRAYYCAPFSRNMLAASTIFAVAAQERNLDMVTVMSQWLADPTSPSIQTRDLWLADQLFAWMPDVPIVTVNPGWFADNYRMAGLDVIAQLGVMMAPLGSGLNAPPSNEDIARVIVGTLIDPGPHLGKTYRPTGPRLLSPPEIAEIFGKVVGHRVTYIDMPSWITAKVLRAAADGVPDFQIAQVLFYIEEYKRNAFGIGAPTHVVQEVGGQEPEDFETIARRYMAATANGKRSLNGFSRTMFELVKVMLTPGLDSERFAARHAFPQIRNTRFSSESPDWGATHGYAAANRGAGAMLAEGS